MRIRMMGVLIAALAMSAITVASAAAATPPDYGRCLKVSVAKSGVWGNTGCTKTGGTKANEYEWYPGFEGAKPIVKPGYKTKLKPTTTATLETVKGDKVVCTGETGAGYIYTPNYSVVTSMTLTGCASGGFACQSESQPAGTIDGGGNYDYIGWINQPLKKVGGLLAVPGWQFSCSGGTLAGLTVYIYNGAWVPLKAGKMLKAETVKYVATAGKQKPEEGEPYGHYVLEAHYYNSLGEYVGQEQIGLTAAIVQTNAEKIEINPVV
jgi:hypothetical protein